MRNWPGVQMPVEITWEKNRQRSGVTAELKIEDSYLRLFPAKVGTLKGQCPRPDLALEWEDANGEPEHGNTTMCWIAWRETSNGTVVGFAYLAIGEPVAAVVYRRYSDGKIIVEIE